MATRLEMRNGSVLVTDDPAEDVRHKLDAAGEMAVIFLAEQDVAVVRPESVTLIVESRDE